MVTRAGLREISTYAQGIGPSRERVLGTAAAGPTALGRGGAPRRADGLLLDAAGGERLPAARTCGSATPPSGLGDALAEARQLLALGVDGLITDSPDHAVQAVARAC